MPVCGRPVAPLHVLNQVRTPPHSSKTQADPSDSASSSCVRDLTTYSLQFLIEPPRNLPGMFPVALRRSSSSRPRSRGDAPCTRPWSAGSTLQARTRKAAAGRHLNLAYRPGDVIRAAVDGEEPKAPWLKVGALTNSAIDAMEARQDRRIHDFLHRRCWSGPSESKSRQKVRRLSRDDKFQRDDATTTVSGRASSR